MGLDAGSLGRVMLMGLEMEESLRLAGMGVVCSVSGLAPPAGLSAPPMSPWRVVSDDWLACRVRGEGIFV